VFSVQTEKNEDNYLNGFIVIINIIVWFTQITTTVILHVSFFYAATCMNEKSAGEGDRAE